MLEVTTVGCLVQPPCSSRAILEHKAQDCVQTKPLWADYCHTQSRSKEVLPHASNNS